MDWLKTSGAPAMIGGGTALSFASNMAASNATRLMAQRRQQAAEYTAAQLETNAGQVTAAGQASANEVRRQGSIVNSNLLASAAASGGGASDPTIVNLIARNAGETAYRAALADYEGQDAARTLRMKGAAARYGAALTSADAEAAATSYKTRALSTALTGASSLFSKYWTGPATGGGKDFDLIRASDNWDE